MNWTKLGCVLAAEGQRPWMVSHIANPVPLVAGRRVRVYFSSRDALQRSHVGWADLDFADGRPVITGMAEEPCLAPGELGHFDDHGVYVSSIVEHDGALWMYYSGWNPGQAPLYYSAIGVAVSEDHGRRFRRLTRAPVLARSEADPWMVAGPFVMRTPAGWRMWYVSGLGWFNRGDQMWSRYDLKHATSANGLDWTPGGVSVLPLVEAETNVCRPWIDRDADGYHMWFASAGAEGYRLGRATSVDGLGWKRQPLSPSLRWAADGWDSRGSAYPAAFTMDGRQYLLYAGNDCGKGGLGLAVADAR